MLTISSNRPEPFPLLRGFNLYNKQGFTLIETLLSLILVGIITSSAFIFSHLLYQQNDTSFEVARDKLAFESLRLFLAQAIKNDPTLQLLSYDGSQLFYDGALLEKNVASFTIARNTSTITLEICLKQEVTFCTQIVLRR